LNERLQRVGIGLVLMGIVFFAAGGFTLYKTQQGASALRAFSTAQNVTLTYNDQGQLVDRGETAGADKIMALLVNDWGYSVDKAELDPKDPIVNTASEYMYQMATIAYHTLHATTTVTFPADVVVDGKVVQPAGTYDFVNDGRYWTGFDRTDPIQGAARDQIWTGTAHALIAELGVGSVTASALTMGLGIAALFALVGATVVLTGLGLIWATRAAKENVTAPVFKPVTNPARRSTASRMCRLRLSWRARQVSGALHVVGAASASRGSGGRRRPS
jgi:hypothetical protein